MPDSDQAQSHSRRLLSPVAQGLALFISLFSILNLLGDLFTPGFDANIWWIDFRPLHHMLTRLILAGFSALPLAYVIRPAAGTVRRSITIAAVGLVMLVAFWNAVHFYILLAQDEIHSKLWLPFSAFVVAALLVLLFDMLHPARRPRSRLYWPIASLFVVFCTVAFPLAQMVCFGKTDYRRPAEVIVVFGARAYANGEPSDALADRVRTACQLYRDGIARKLIFSGGPGDGAIDEPACMRRFALKLGVKDEDILLDSRGLNTARTVANTIPILDRLRAGRVIVVSHFYHLPRVKMTYARAGREVYTVPARETYVLTQMPYLIAREVAALWAYYLSPIVGGR